MNQTLLNCLLDIMKQDGGIHPFYQNLETVIPLKDPLVLRRLKKMLGCLAYWSPFIKQVILLSTYVTIDMIAYSDTSKLCPMMFVKKKL
jgi:hypothetical protein